MIIKLSDYDQYVFEKDATLAVVEAIRALKDGDTLLLGGGELHFYPEYAHEKEYYISNNDYSKKRITFHMENKTEITIDGEGAKLIFHGRLSPFVFHNCNGVYLKNLSIDYDTPFFAQAVITDVTEGYTELLFEGAAGCRIANQTFYFCSGDNSLEVAKQEVLVTEFDKDTKAPSAYLPPYFASLGEIRKDFLASMCRKLTAVEVRENQIRLYGNVGYQHNIGNWLIFSFGERFHPGIFVTDCKNIHLDNIIIYHSSAMGVICQLTENIILNNVCCMVEPGSDRMLSVSADATHFVNCSGMIQILNCRFTSMMDDAGNIHGIYMLVKRKLDNHTLLFGYGHRQQRGINIFSEGDQIQLVDNQSMLPLQILTVKESEMISGEYVRVVVNETISENLKVGHVAENLSKMPELIIDNCECGNNRPRGFLISTYKKSVVKNCLFYNMYSAIECAGDANSWYESGSVRDLTIRNNRFWNSAYAGGNVISICPNIPTYQGAYHQNIRIIHNEFRLHEPRFLYARCTDGLVFKNNTYIQDSTLPTHNKTGKNGIITENCRDCDIQEI